MESWRAFSDVTNHKWTIRDMSDTDEDFYIGLFSSADLTRQTHNHEFIQIYYIKTGVLHHFIEGIEDTLSMGDLFIVFPGVSHRLEVVDNSDVEYYCIAFMPQFVSFSYKQSSIVEDFLQYITMGKTIEKELSAYPVKPRISLDGKLQMRAETIVYEMYQEYVQKEAGYYSSIRGLTLLLLTLIAREYSSTKYYNEIKGKTNFYQDAILKSIEYIEKNFREDIKLNEVARKFLLSRTYFCALFKNRTGTTFNKYLNSLRIGFAKILLASTNLSITEVAFSSGFNDTSNFSRQFTKHINLTPSEYRSIVSSPQGDSVNGNSITR